MMIVGIVALRFVGASSGARRSFDVMLTIIKYTCCLPAGQFTALTSHFVCPTGILGFLRRLRIRPTQFGLL